MYIVYLDESGNPNGWNSNQNHFVLGGLAVHEGQIRRLSDSLDEVQSRFFYDVNLPLEFHATEINSGKGRFHNLTSLQRQNLMNDVYDVIANIEYPRAILFATAINISSVNNPDQAVRDTFEDVIQCVNSFLVRMYRAGNPQKGLLIIDRASFTEPKYRTLISEFRNAGTQFGYLGNIVDIPYFSQSEDTRLLQLADFCAYAVFRYYERGDDQYLNKIIHRFDRRSRDYQGVDGLKHITQRECGCLACSA
ncbi:MAG: DUF3800 domain-containing protein [Chloroflexi bacterium]|nr:DUF3800 domain-containing protein [Chloroflexota bacterium]